MSLTEILTTTVVILLLMVLGVLDVRISDGRTEVTLHHEKVIHAARRAAEKGKSWFRRRADAKSRQSS